MPSPRHSRNGPFGWKLKDTVVPGQNGFDRIQTFPRCLWLLCIYSVTFGHDLLGGVVEATQDRQLHRLVSLESFNCQPAFLGFRVAAAIFSKSNAFEDVWRTSIPWPQR